MPQGQEKSQAYVRIFSCASWTHTPSLDGLPAAHALVSTSEPESALKKELAFAKIPAVSPAPAIQGKSSRGRLRDDDRRRC